MEAWFTAPATGAHTFRIAADDNAHLWFGTRCDEAMAADPIASVPGWTSARQWNKYGEQTAAPIALEEGRAYYMRAVVNEGGGGDNLAVGVTTPSATMNPIPVCDGAHVYLSASSPSGDACFIPTPLPTAQPSPPPTSAPTLQGEELAGPVDQEESD